MDKRNIDGHKLYYHPEKVAQWLQGWNERYSLTLYMEVSPTGACNHRCKFCALDYLEYEPHYLHIPSYINFLKSPECSSLTGIMFGGEGEPLMHKDFEQIVEATNCAGIDAGLTTNGVLLNSDRASAILPMLKWVKFSIDAGNKDTYRFLRKAGTHDWQKLWDNIKFAVAGKYCTVGTQFLLLEDNWNEVESFVKLSKMVGANYCVIKTYSRHLKSNNNLTVLDPRKYQYLQDMEDDKFKVILRSDDSARKYDKCRALPFWQYLKADGTLWACSAHLGDERFKIGDITGGMSHKESDLMIDKFDITECRLNCRMNNINEYLHRLLNPENHDNFI